MSKRQILITRKDMIQFMGEDKYNEFIGHIVKRIKSTVDYDNIQEGEPFWIIGEW